MTKPFSDFYLNQNGKPRNSYCKPCWVVYTGARQKEAAAARRAARVPRTDKRCAYCEETKPLADFRSRAREGRTDYSSYCIGCESHYHRERTYGLSREEYAALHEQQAGCCAICGSGLGDRHAVDHDHDTGAVRGLLCRDCNLGLGRFGDDPDRLMAAAAYLLARADVLRLA